MHSSPRRLARTAAAAAFGSAALAAPAAAQQPTVTADASTDSVLATGLAPGQTTLQALRRDPLTGNQVVIGQFAGSVLGYLPFSVNTTTPTVFNPGGDCWQAGKLSLAGGAGLTPDLLPGDTIAISSGPSAVVPQGGSPAAGSGGPVPGCGSLSAFGRNAITGATGGDGADVILSGVAQPLATGVAVTATDGHANTPATNGTLAADGTWTANLPLTQLTGLADGTVILNGIYAVPDVATGAAAHIGGVPMSLTKHTTGGGVNITPGSPASPGANAPARVTGLRTARTISLASARRGGIRVSFIVPSGAKAVRLRLSRGNRTVVAKFVDAGKPGARQTVRLKSAALARRLKRGSYRLSVAAGPSRDRLGKARVAAVRVR